MCVCIYGMTVVCLMGFFERAVVDVERMPRFVSEGQVRLSAYG